MNNNNTNNIEEIQQQIKQLINNNTITEYGEIIQLHESSLDNIAEQLLRYEAKRNTYKLQKRKTGYNIRKHTNDFENTLKAQYGSFYFNFYNRLSETLEKQYKFRFMFLCCFLSYNNKLQHLNTNKYIKEDELNNLLKLSKREYIYTKQQLLKYNLITINADNTISINVNYCSKGSINKYNNNEYNEYTRVFKSAIINMYNNAAAIEHKKLYICFALLKYVHYKYNILCFNTDCENINDIQAITIDNIAADINMYKDKNTSKLKRYILNISVNNQKAFIYIEDYKKKFFVINPCVFYKGNNLKDLQYLIDIFKM